MNEELHSTNSELQTINDGLGQRTDELNGLNLFLESTFTSLAGGIVVLDRDLRVLVWDAECEELWGVRRAEVLDAQFLTLDIGLPVTELSRHILGVLDGAAASSVVTVDATNRRGRAMGCEVRCSPLLQGDGTISGVMLMMEPAA